MHSKIIISSQWQDIKDELEKKLQHRVKFFISDDFLIENAQAVIKESYIAESEEKVLVIMAKTFRIEAQNSLLKIIEEPPRNIKFIIVTHSKNMLLLTIRSRLMIETRLSKTQRLPSGLNLKQLDLKDIYKFIEEIEQKERTDEFGKNELKALISTIVLEATQAGFKFSQDEFEYFYSLVNLAELNSKSHSLLTPLLLTILKKGRIR